jgi:hypothetical protein
VQTAAVDRKVLQHKLVHATGADSIPLGSPFLAVYHPKHLLLSIKTPAAHAPHSRRGFQVGPEAQARHDTVSPLAADWLTTPSESVN